MRINVYQSIGTFNYLNPSEKQYRFSACIQDTTSNRVDTVRNEKGFLARIECIAEAEYAESFFNTDFSNFDEVLVSCLSYANRVMSSRNYKEEALAFLEIFIQNREELTKNIVLERRVEIEEEIKELQQSLDSLSDFSFSFCILRVEMKEKISTLEKWIVSLGLELPQYVAGSPKHIEALKRLASYTEEKEKYEKLLITLS